MTCSKTACVPQKQPPAKTATSSEDFAASGASTAGGGNGAFGAAGTPDTARTPYQAKYPTTAIVTRTRGSDGDLKEVSMLSLRLLRGILSNNRKLRIKCTEQWLDAG